MAFVAILPAGGSILTGLGAAASSIPLIGGSLSALGGGLGGALSALGAGNILGAGTSLLGGLSGTLGGLYTGADKLLGGFLPNLAGFPGGAVGISPAEGFLGSGGLGLLPQAAAQGGLGSGIGAIMPGGTTSGAMATAHPAGFNPFDAVASTPGMLPDGTIPGAANVANFNAANPFDLAEASGYTLANSAAPLSMVDKGKAMLKGLHQKVDPVLGPVADAGVALGTGMDLYNKLTGAGQPTPGGMTTPAQAAQVPQYNPYIPTTKTPPLSTNVNIAAPQAAQATAAGPQSTAYVPMDMGGEKSNEQEMEEELEEFKEMLAMNANFLSGVTGRVNQTV